MSFDGFSQFNLYCRHYTGKHKVVEQYLANDIENGKVKTLAQIRAEEEAAASAATKAYAPAMQQHPATPGATPLPNLDVTTNPTLPSFETTALELQQNNGDRMGLSDFLDAETATVTSSGTSTSERIMQVDGVNEVWPMSRNNIDDNMDTTP